MRNKNREMIAANFGDRIVFKAKRRTKRSRKLEDKALRKGAK